MAEQIDYYVEKDEQKKTVEKRYEKVFDYIFVKYAHIFKLKAVLALHRIPKQDDTYNSKHDIG